MPDGRAAEPAPGSLGQRALGAMESAARRAREAEAPPPSGVRAADTGSGRPPGRSDRWLIGSIAVVAALVVSAATALVVSENTGPSPPSPAVAGTSPSTSGEGHATTTSTTLAAVAGGPPVISSLSPASGSAGQAIVVAGSNFLSSSGQIVATFNGEAAPTSCPAQNTCNVTVPASTSPSAQVAITTAGGTSNAVTFTYG